MKWQQLVDGPERTWAIVFDEGDDPLSGLTTFAERSDVRSARFTAVGGFSSVRLGYFRIDRQDYDPIDVDEQVEILSLLGDIALAHGRPKVHAHAVVGRFDGSTRGGHLLAAEVRPTLEVVLDEYPAFLRRRFDERFGIALIDPSRTEPPRSFSERS